MYRLIAPYLMLALTSGCAAPFAYHRGPATSLQAEQLAQRAERSLREGKVKAAQAAAKAALATDAHLAHAHEILAQIAWLRADEDGAWTHFFQALSDGRDEAALPRLAMLSARPSQRAALRGLFDAMTAHAKDGAARWEALMRAVPLAWADGDSAGARRRGNALRVVRRWRAIGGFDNEQHRGYSTPYGPETELRFDKSYPVSQGVARWRPLEIAAGRTALSLRSLLYPMDWNTAYLATFVRPPRAGAVTMWLRTTDPVKVWVNDRLVVATRELTRSSFFAMRVPVRLEAGYNKVLVKTCQSDGGWWLAMGFADEAGRPLSLDESITPQPFERGAGPAGKGFDAAWVIPQAVARFGDAARRSFWRALMLDRGGYPRLALSALRQHLERWPRDPVALYVAARLAARSGQQQMAADLLSRGLALPWPFSSGATLQRVRSLRKREQVDRALDLLRDMERRTRGAGEDPAASRAWVREMDLLLTAKDWQLDRCNLVQRAIQHRPQNADLYATWASCLGALGREKQALEKLRRAVELAPLDRGTRALFARRAVALGRCEEARRHQRRTTELFATHPREWIRRGDFARRCGAPEQALKHYRQAAELRPGWSLPLQREGLLHYEAGRVEEALQKWRAALRRDAEDESLWDRVNWIRPEKDPVLDALQPSEKEITAAIAAAKTTLPLPGASVIWLLDHEASRLMPDGTFKRVVTIVRMAVDRAGRDSLGEASLPKRGLVKVLDAYIVDRTGARREVTSMHGRKVRYPAIKEGSVVVLRYRHTRHAGGYLRQHLATSWFFQHALGQVVRAEWALAIPRERQLSIARQGAIAHRTSKGQGVTIHHFAARDVPPLRPERHSLPRRDLLRAVTVSTVPSWDYFSSWGRSLTSEVFEITPELGREVKRLVAGARSVEEKVARVYHFVVKEIRYQQDYETFIAGVKPHPAAAVLARRYGDCKDKSVLIIAMLRHLGIRAEFALIRVRGAGRVARGVPYQQFNHAVAYLPAQRGVDGARFLDATAENLDLESLRGDVQGTLSLVLSEKGHRFVEVPYQPSRFNRSRARLALTLDAKGDAAGALDWQFVGQRAGALRKPLQNAEVLKQLAQSIVHRIYPGGQLSRADSNNERDVRRPLEVKIEGRFTDVAEQEDGGLRLRLPRLLSIAAWASWTTRKHSLFFGPPQQTQSDVIFSLPSGFHPRELPKDVKIEGRCLLAQGRWSSQAGGMRLHYEQRVVRRCAEIAPREYERFRDRVNALERALNREVVLVKKPTQKSQRRRRRAR